MFGDDDLTNISKLVRDEAEILILPQFTQAVTSFAICYGLLLHKCNNMVGHVKLSGEYEIYLYAKMNIYFEDFHVLLLS
jgi:hypothetical protein